TGAWYTVLAGDGQKCEGSTRGKIRLEGIRETNAVAMGDRVEDITGDTVSSAVLILDNHILPASVMKTGHSNVLTANFDQVMIMATLSFPRTSLGFIDRVTVASEAFRIPQVIVFNKIDMLDEEGQNTLLSVMELYRSIGITCLSLSALHDDISPVLDLLQNKVTLL